MSRHLPAIVLTLCAALVPVAAVAADTAAKSERAMSPESAKAGASPNTKSERAMDKNAAEPGKAPAGKSERAMDPAKSD